MIISLLKITINGIYLHIQKNMDSLSANIYISSNAFARRISAIADENLKPFGFSASYAFVLLAADKDGGIGQKELGEQFHMAPSTITRFIDKMENQNLLSREQNGKAVTVQLSRKGKDLITEIKIALAEIDDEINLIMGDKYAETLNKMLLHGISLITSEKKK
jgi:DNA-binding MarR family transcriptional regulator